MTSNVNTKISSVVKRDGTIIEYNPEKISLAIGKALMATQCRSLTDGERTTINTLVKEIEGRILEIFEADEVVVGVETVQDIVEATLIKNSMMEVAIQYIRYRRDRASIRNELENPNIRKVVIKTDSGIKYTFTEELIAKKINGLKDNFNLQCVDTRLIVDEFFKNAYDNMSTDDYNSALLMSTRCFIERDPEYDTLCVMLETENIHSEFTDSVGGSTDVITDYIAYLKNAVKNSVLSEDFMNKVLALDLSKLKDLITTHKADFDSHYLNDTFLGLTSLRDRYLLRDSKTGKIVEGVFEMYLRIALVTANFNLDETVKNLRVMWDKEFSPSTPTLFNSGLKNQQLSSCYIGQVQDDLSDIYMAMHDSALLSKFAGGVAQDWTNVRALGSHIKGTNGKSQGTVPFMKVLNDTALAVNQGGKRRGAICSYLETWHLDIEEFLDLRKNTGDDRRRTHDMNTANWIPDLFMERAEAGSDWTLFSPNDVPDLHSLYGIEFKKAYEAYEEKAKAGEITHFKVVSAMTLWRKMLTALYETGHPWILFKDSMNRYNPQSHVGTIHSSNLCTEIAQNTSKDEIAVCNLGSINLVKILKENPTLDDFIDKDKLSRIVTTAVKMLDNVIDNNFYPVPQAERSNRRHRPIGLGIMGEQDLCYELGIAFDSDEAIKVTEVYMEEISKAAWVASNSIAMEKGSYETFDGSAWSKGILPCDKRIDGGTISMYEGEDHLELRKMVSTGMRNSNVLAIAPTATIANIVGVTPSIEPTYQNLFVKSNLSGEFTIINKYLVKALKKEGLWNNKMIADLKFFEGDVSKIDVIPKYLKDIYKTAFDLDPIKLIDKAACRQMFVDQSQSLNLYLKNPNGKLLDQMYKHAWKVGLKATYYLRTMSASTVEKSTGDGTDLVQVAQFCSIDNPDCEACQ